MKSRVFKKSEKYRIDQEILRNKALRKGVNLISPETIYLSKDTSFGKNVTVEPYVVFGPKVKIGDNSYKNLMSVSANNGVPIKSFGKNGVVKLNNPSITSPAIYKENLIITTSEPSLEVYNLNTGKLLWKYILMEKKNENRLGGKRYDYSGGNPWGGFSLDKERGIAFITTGNAGRYFMGWLDPGYINSIIAIDIRKLWDFQEVRLIYVILIFQLLLLEIKKVDVVMLPN